MSNFMVKIILAFWCLLGGVCFSGERVSGVTWTAVNEVTGRSVLVSVRGKPWKWYENILETIRRGPSNRKYIMAKNEYLWLRNELDPLGRCCREDLITYWRKVEWPR